MDIDVAGMGLSALRVLLVGLAFGAGLPMIFALGMRLQAVGAGDRGEGITVGRRNPAATATAYLLFAVVIAAVIVGVLFVTRNSLHHYLGISLFGA